MTRRSVVDVDQALDRVRLRGLPLIVVICAAVILILDGFDIQVIGVAAAGGTLLAQAGAAGFFGDIGGALLLSPVTVLLVRRHIARDPRAAWPAEPAET